MFYIITSYIPANGQLNSASIGDGRVRKEVTMLFMALCH